jgi:hypothetical protein
METYPARIYAILARVEQKGPRKGWRYDPAEQWDKPHPTNADFRLRMEIIGVATRQSPWYRIRYSVCEGSEERSNLGLCDWADWDHHHGDLVYAKGGSLFRQRLEGKRLLPAARLVEMNELQFNEVVAPPAAKQWPK